MTSRARIDTKLYATGAPRQIRGRVHRLRVLFGWTLAVRLPALTLAMVVLAGSLAGQSTKSKPSKDTTTSGVVTPLNCPLGGCSTGGNSPTVTFRHTITGIIHSGAAIADTVNWCDDTGLNSTSRSVTRNGTALSTNYTGWTGCFATAWSAFTITPVIGTNQINASINDNAGQTGSAAFSFTYDTMLVYVTPDGAQKAKQWSTATADTFTVQNANSNAVTFTLALTCSNAASLGCSAPATVAVAGNSSAGVVVSYSTRGYNSVDTVTLRATTPDGHQSDAGSVIETASIAQLTVRFDANNQDNQNLRLCANDCFTTVLSHSTASYRSLGADRSVALVYHGDRTAVRPFVVADVPFPSGAVSPTEMRLQATVNGIATPFVNGETVLHFSTSGWKAGETHRLAGQLDLRSMATNMYPLQLSVTAVYPDHSETFTNSSKVMVVNERTPGLLPTVGWTVAGIQQLFRQADGTMLIVEGDGSGVYFSCLTYTACPGPAGDYSTLTSTGSGASLRYTRAYPDSSKIVFDTAGHAIKVVDRWGNADSVTYDASNRISTIGDPFLPTFFQFVYGTGSFTIRLPGPGGGAPWTARQTTVAYDGSGHITSFTDADGGTTRFTYDTTGRVSTMLDRLGDTTSYVYDASSWKLASIALPTIAVGTQGLLQRPTLTMRSAQQVGVPTGATATTFAIAPAIDTIRASSVGPINDATQFTVNRWGQPLTVIDPLSDTTKIVRSGIFATSVTNPLGQKDSAVYTNGLLTASMPYHQPTTNISYDAWGMPSQITGGNAPTVTRSFDAVHYKITTTAAGAYASTDSLDTRGRVVRSVDAAGHATTYHYDATFGNVDTTRAAAGQWSAAVFDGYGRDSVLTALGHPQAVRRIYDILGRDSLTYDGVNAQPAKYTYNALYLTTVRDQRGQVYRQDLNALGWPTVIYDPADTVNWTIKRTFRYDSGGRVVSWQNRRGSWINQQWDKLGRITSQQDDIGTDSTWYSPNGRTVIVSNAISTDTIKVGDDGADSVTTVIPGINQWFRRVHSATSGVTSDTTFFTSSIGPLQNRINFWSQTRGVLDSLAVGSSHYRFGYTNELLPDTLRYPGSLLRIDSLTSTHQVYARHYTASAVEQAASRGYAYDSLGRVTMESRPSSTAGNTILRYYGYTGTGALQRYKWTLESPVLSCSGTYGCSYTGGTQTSVSQNLSFGYDPVNNLTSQVDSANGNALISGAFAAGNRLTAWGVAGYTYDPDGNRASSGGTTYTWSARGRLAKVTSGSNTVEYDYNAIGELVRRKTNGVIDRYFIWDNGELVLLLDGSGNRIAEYAYLPSGEPLSYSTGPLATPSTYYYSTDLHGNVIGVSDGANVDQQNTLGPWGDIEGSQTGWGFDSTRLGWKGNVWDGGIANLYYVHNRWYDPASRSFISEDPLGIGGGLNTYAYAGNDPVNGWDPSGLNDEVKCTDIILMPEPSTVDGEVTYRPICVGGTTGGNSDPAVLDPIVSIGHHHDPDEPTAGPDQAPPHSPAGSIKGAALAVANWLQRPCVQASAEFLFTLGTDALFFTGVGELEEPVKEAARALYESRAATGRAARRLMASAVGNAWTANALSFEFGNKLRDYEWDKANEGTNNWMDYVPGLDLVHPAEEVWAACHGGGE